MTPHAQVRVTTAGELTVVALTGDLTADRSGWRGQLEAGIRTADRDVVIDLAGVVDWDPSAQAALFHIAREEHARGRRLSLEGLTGRLRHEVHDSGMDTQLLGPPPPDDEGAVAAPEPRPARQRRSREQDGAGSSGWD